VNGQLGTGNRTNVTRPHQVTTPAATSWISVSAGENHTCAVRADATLWCWGANFLGQLGTGGTTGNDVPQQVTSPAADGWASVSAGGQDTCAVRADGTLWCWGANINGALGLGTTTGQSLPQQVTTPASTGWARVSMGGGHTCAIRGDATLWCWGSNFQGQLGIGSNTEQARPQRVSVPARTGWTLITSGAHHTCATHTGHALWCWGLNRTGELGLGSTTDQNLPQQVTA
jgi:alpha-tubulin suppressor-like RCC1 family protein